MKFRSETRWGTDVFSQLKFPFWEGDVTNDSHSLTLAGIYGVLKAFPNCQGVNELSQDFAVVPHDLVHVEQTSHIFCAHPTPYVHSHSNTQRLVAASVLLLPHLSTTQIHPE